MFTLIRFSTSQEWGDILKVMEIYGNEYFFYFLSFYIIIIVGFFNGLIVVFGNAFTNNLRTFDAAFFGPPIIILF